MLQLPRIAVGTVQYGADNQPMLWALLDVLQRSGPQIQTFLSQAGFASLNGAVPITGQSHRHLDSWLMSQAACQEIFYHGARSCDLAIIEGQYDQGRRPAAEDAFELCGGSLDTLCDWLDLPRLAILDASQLDTCRLPLRPARLDGLLLDRVASSDDACRLQATFEALWGAPCLGVLEELPAIRAVIGGLPRGANPSRQLCRTLGDRLAPCLRLKRFWQIANRREFPSVAPCLFRCGETEPLNVAVAYDEAFHCYFPDVLDLLEARGATIRDFSPLRSEALPPGTDLVYIGCGHAEHYAHKLASNHCMKQALRCHAKLGGRIYAEGSGLAYLCEQMVDSRNRHLPMVGALPAVARLNPNPVPLQPVEVVLSRNSWLGEKSSRLRGYLNTYWIIEPAGCLTSHAAEPEHRSDLVGRRNVFGSRLHVNFAAQPQFLHSFFQPLSPSKMTVVY